MSCRRPFRSAALSAAVLAASAGTAVAATLQVPSQFPTIQSAIAAAAAGDEIVVAPGTYAERIDFLGKNIVVRASGGAALTTIDGGLNGPVVSFVTQEPATARLEGFRITGGRVTNGFGAGVRIVNASPTIAGCIVIGNEATADCSTCTAGGGGIFVDGGAPTVVGTTITGNAAIAVEPVQGISGGGVRVASGTLSLTDSTVSSNTISAFHSGGGLSIGSGNAEAVLTRTLVTGHTTVGALGGGAYVGGGTLRLNDSTFDNNTASSSGGSAIGADAPALVEIIGSTISNNQATKGSTGGVNVVAGTLAVEDTLFEANFSDSGAGAALDLTNTVATISGATFRQNVTDSGSGGALRATESLVTITGSGFTENLAPNGSGGAIQSVASGVTVSTTQFTDNAAENGSGGAVIVSEGNFECTGCTFTGNSASNGQGGAVTVESNSNATLTGCTLTGNGDGPSSDAAIDATDSDLNLVNTTIADNLNGGVLVGNGVLNMTGGSISGCTLVGLFAFASDITLTDATISNNVSTSGAGGGAAISGGTFTVNRSTFSGNAAPGSSAGGGALYIGGAAVGTINASRLTANGLNTGAGQTNGGAITIANTARLTITNSVIDANAGTSGALRILNNARINLVNSTAANNTLAVNHNFAVISSTIAGSPATLDISNSILRTDLSPGRAMFTRSGTNTALSGSFSNIQGGLAGGSSIIDTDPLFENAAAGNYRLLPGSPSIDAGSNGLVPPGVTTDFAGNARVVRGLPGPGVAVVDMGAFEVQPATCYANCDGSTSVPALNALDFSCFLTRYRAGDPYANCDGSTNIPTLNAIDFSCFLSRYTAGCP